jgi:hypothetical protein
LLHASPARPHPPCVDGERVWQATREKPCDEDPVRLARTVNQFAQLSQITRVGLDTPSPMWQARGGRRWFLACLSQPNSFTGGTSPPGFRLVCNNEGVSIWISSSWNRLAWRCSTRCTRATFEASRTRKNFDSAENSPPIATPYTPPTSSRSYQTSTLWAKLENGSERLFIQSSPRNSSTLFDGPIIIASPRRAIWGDAQAAGRYPRPPSRRNDRQLHSQSVASLPSPPCLRGPFLVFPPGTETTTATTLPSAIIPY